MTMDVKVRKIEGMKGTVNAPPSKSYTHRAFVIASLAEGTSRIINPLNAGDTLSTLHACEAFGVKIAIEKNEVIITGSGGWLRTPGEIIDCGNSGTTIRLISSIAALNGEVTLTGDESVQKRPMQPLLDALKQLGVEAFSKKGDGTPPVVIKGGGIKGGEVKIRGDISSQFISSLLIASPYAREDVTISITTPLKSAPYVDITSDTMEKFGVKVKNENYERLLVQSGAKYRGRRYAVEGDYSSAAYFMALAALTKSKITVKNLQRNSMQGDKKIVEILQNMGAEVKAGKTEVKVKGNTLEGIEADLSNTPDLLPTLAAVACFADGKTEIKNIEHARYKESDRIAACASEFRKFGAKIEERKNGLAVTGSSKLKGAAVNSHNDHRMAMALTVAGLAADGATVIKNVECVEISFPDFYEILSKITGNAISLY